MMMHSFNVCNVNKLKSRFAGPPFDFPGRVDEFVPVLIPDATLLGRLNSLDRGHPTWSPWGIGPGFGK